MRAGRKKTASLLLTLALVGLNLVACNALLGRSTRARIDLTEERLYSISPATERILSGLEEELTVYGYFSRRTHPKLAPLVPQIKDVLDEYRALSGGRLQVEIIDPREDEQAEREANERFGVESTPFRLASKYEAGIVNAYFALVLKYGDQYVRYGFDDLIRVEPTPDGDVEVRLRNLEYDLTRGIKKVVFGFRSSAELFERVEQPLRFTAVMTPGDLPELLRELPAAVRTAAAELEREGGDQFEYVEIDPSSSPEAEEEVRSRFGARPMTLGLFDERQFYLYGFLESGERIEQLALTGEGVSAATVREAVEDVLRRQTPGFLKVIGVVAPRPEIPPELMMQLQMQGRMPPQPPPEFEQLQRLLELDYEVREIDLESAGGVPTDVDTLLVLKPANLSDRAVYHLDQYLMRGGPLMLCVGRFEARFQGGGLQVTPLSSGLEDWLEQKGLRVEPTLVLDDRNQPLPIPEVRMTALGAIRTWRMAPYPYLVEVGEVGFVHKEIASRLNAVGIYWGSPLTLDQEDLGEVEALELLRSSSLSWTSDDTSRVDRIDYEVPREGTSSQLLAVALQGKFTSLWQDREPPAAEPDEEGAQDDAAAVPSVPLDRSPQTRLVVVGNAAFVSDLVARALGAGDSGFFAENLAFVQNVIDWLNLDSDLAGIRTRDAGARRLQRLTRGKEVLVETVNYLLPLLLVLAWGAYRLWRRRNTPPLLVPTRPAARSER